MKLIPLALVILAAYMCGALRDRLQQPSPSPTPAPAVTINIDPTPTATPQLSRLPVTKTISGGVLNEKAKSLPPPLYPPAARAVRATGAVTVQVLVDEEGRVVSAVALSGHPLLRSAAVQAARKAEFEPALLSGHAVKVSGVLTYTFAP